MVKGKKDCLVKVKSKLKPTTKLKQKVETLALDKSRQRIISKTCEDSPVEIKPTIKLKEKVLADTLALDKSQQREVSKKTKKIKTGLKDGSIKLKSEYKEKKLKAEQKRGLVYIGHIPHGFYEEEMRNYFKQFGKVTNVKVCRSRVSGKSKGFGYIEFLHPEVAKIAADTMNNYVMFKKRIVTEYVPYEKRPKSLFHGKSSNLQHTSVKTRRGKQKYSRNKILDDTIVKKKANTTLKKFQAKVQRLKTLGIDCKLNPILATKQAL